MATQSWLKTIQSAKKTSVVNDGRTKIHYTFDNDQEMVEQYDNQTEVLIERKWKRLTQIGGEGAWTYEVGLAPDSPSTIFDSIQESNANPIFSRCDSKNSFQWRIRNLPYPADVYNLSIDTEKDNIILRTTNKKYFKRFEIPDLQRLGIKLELSSLSKAHSNNTLVISFEKALKSELSQIKPISGGDIPCASM